MGSSRSPRYGARITNFLIHTQEGNGTAESLASYLNNPGNGVSYHYTVDNSGVLFDVVDTDYASWSVLDANSFTINLCFAGSRASWTRKQWLDNMSRAIDIAAWVAVQDARKYRFSTQVITPPYFHGEGISDHRYVTDELGIGTHTDVGPGFPWDVFTAAVDKYVSGGEEKTVAGVWDEEFVNFKGISVSFRTAMRYDDEYINQIRDDVVALSTDVAALTALVQKVLEGKP